MIDDLAERFATAILGANMSGLEAILSPDFTIWYNFSDATLSREQALAFFGKYVATVSVRFRDIRRLLTPQGWDRSGERRVGTASVSTCRCRGWPSIDTKK